MNPASWFLAGVIFAINTAGFLLGALTIAAVLAVIGWTLRSLLHPLARRAIIWHATRTAWRHHHASGRQVT